MTNTMALLPGLLLATACTVPERLEDVPIIGGTDEVRAAIRAELAAFDEATGFGRARVSKVRVRDLGGIAGRYNRVSRGISLDAGLEPDLTAEALRHELCHALDFQENLEKDPTLYERRAEELLASDRTPVEPENYKSTSRQRHELFALYCQMGPWVAHTLAETCPGDPEDGQAILRQLAEEVWINADAPMPTRPQPEWAFFQIPEDSEIQDLFTFSTTDPEVFYLNWGSWIAYLNVRTGDGAGRRDHLQASVEKPSGLPPELGVRECLGWETGPCLTTVTVDLYDQGEANRTVWYDGERWWLAADGCPDREPFIADHRVFTLRQDGHRISWGPVAP